MKKALEAFPFRVHRALTDNGAEFATRRRGGRASRTEHPLVTLPLSKDIRHRLTALYTPRTDGMAERFVGLIKAETVKRAEYPGHAALKARRWYKERSELFRRDPASFAEGVPKLSRPDT